MSLLATSYRYEIESCNAKALKKALSRQEARINEDDKYANSKNTVHTERMINEVSNWSENREEASGRRKAKRDKEDIQEELRLGRKCTVLVRREQLSRLLQAEQELFEAELNAIGKAFHLERL